MQTSFLTRMRANFLRHAALRLNVWSARILVRGLGALGSERSPAGDSVIQYYLDHRKEQLLGLMAGDGDTTARQTAFGQEGEDLILTRLVAGMGPCYYVDIGAHHPFRFSNTYLLHKAGWKGINVDATPGLIEVFRTHRPGDANLEMLIGEGGDERVLHLFNEPAVNTVSSETMETRDLSGTDYREIGTVTRKTVPLRDVLEGHLPKDAVFGVLSVDVEGEELGVLRSNDWSRFRPKFILVEQQMTADLYACLQHEITRLLQSVGYVPIAKAYNTVFFRSEDRG